MNPQILEVTEESPDHVCNFCHKHQLNPIEWGPMYQLSDITLHYFCLLFSAGLNQNGQDNEGVLGFLVADIRKEIRRGNKLKCAFCKKHGATVGCIRQSCKSSFHYTCGVSHGTLHQFYDQFCSFCPKHKPTQNIPKEAEWVCPICFVEVESKDEGVWPPCCGKSVFHRSCLMRAAKSAGYFFKCPLCNNNSEKFLLTMRCNGVFVPEEDAAWEREPNSFAELTQQYSKCDAANCLCPAGREMDDKADMRWKIVRCGGCGATATHIKCSELQGVLSWKCETCLGILADNSRVNTSVLASAPARSLRTHVDERNLNYSSESDDRTSEGSDSDTTSDTSEEERRIAKRIPNAINIIRRVDTSSESSDETDAEADNLNSPQAQQAELESRPQPAAEEAKQDGPNGIVFNSSLNKQYRVVRTEEERKRKQRTHKKDDQEKKRSKLEGSERETPGASQSQPQGLHAQPLSSTSISTDKKRRHRKEKSSSQRRREKRAAATASEACGNNDSEDAKLQSIYQDVPSTSSLRRRMEVEEAKKRKETIQSILKQSNEQVFDFSKLPKIPKLTRPAKNDAEDHRRKSVVNIERLRQEEEARNQAIRFHRGTDPKFFYHKRPEPTQPSPCSPPPLLIRMQSSTTATNELEPASACYFTDDAPLHNGTPSPSSSTFQIPSISNRGAYSYPPVSVGNQYLPEQRDHIAGGFFDDAPEEGFANELWYPFDEDNRHVSKISEPEPSYSSNNEYPNSSRQETSHGPTRAMFTDFYDDTPVIHFRSPFNSEVEKFKLSRRNYRRSNMPQQTNSNDGTEREKFYNPHSKLRREANQASSQGTRTETKAPEVERDLKPKPDARQEEKVSSTVENGPKMTSSDKQPKGSISNSNCNSDPPLPDSTSQADNSNEVQIASPLKKPEVQVIEVIDLSDSDDDLKIVCEKVSRVSSPPITTVKSAAFLALVSGKPKPVPVPAVEVPPESSAASASSSSSVGNTANTTAISNCNLL